jgi:hypothetical protein
VPEDTLQKDHELAAVRLTLELKVTIGGAQENMQVLQSLDAGIHRNSGLSRLCTHAACAA